nr:unnamed protein product [Spirometra erinaceieuropaei]
MLSKEYKFYLAFENNNCEGYITEKFFFNALGFGMVPIVYGASREEFYQRAPPNSYIHVDDFENVEQLAKYLQYLDKNDTAYATYFAWKEHGEILLWPRVDCRVCGVLYEVLKGKVHLQRQTPSIYRNFFRQYAWVEKELPRDIITATSDNNESLPLIFWDRRILYHSVSTEGCRFKCRYTMNMAECSKAHLAVFTANPPSSFETSSGNTISAFESAEPYQFVAGLSESAKTQV